MEAYILLTSYGMKNSFLKYILYIIFLKQLITDSSYIVSSMTSKVQVSGLSINKQKRSFAYKRENYYELCMRRLHKGVIHAGIKTVIL